MIDLLREVHSVLRWVVLLLALGAIVLAVLSAAASRPWDALSDRSAMFFTIAMDVQVLIGVILWALEARWSGQDPSLSWLHPLLMVGAVGLAHVGRARSDRAASDTSRGRQAALFFGLSLLLVLVAIPFNSWPV